MNIEDFHNSANGPVDIEDADEVEILIREDGKTLWLNTRLGCVVRFCRIKGEIKIDDKRKKRTNKKKT